jgi:trehalose 2-sulfotransferase
MSSYVICATPRSGSTLLCYLLRSSGVAGQPESWFRSQDRAEWAADWRITAADGRYDWPAYLAAAITAATTANGTLGLRLMWNMLCELTAELGPAPPASQAALLAQTFGPLRYIHLTRRDLVAQAISRHKAEVSGTWHLGFEEAETPTVPTYDFNRITRYLREATADNAVWENWFSVNNITPIPVTYEHLSADPVATALAVLGQLGLTPAQTLHAPNVKMADAVSADWAARYLDEAARAGT